MSLRDVIRTAYANAGHIADHARAEGRSVGDLFDIIAAAVETAYGPLVEHTVETSDQDPGRVRFYAETVVGDERHGAAMNDHVRLMRHRGDHGLDFWLRRGVHLAHAKLHLGLAERGLLPLRFVHNGEPIDELPELVEVGGREMWRPR